MGERQAFLAVKGGGVRVVSADVPGAVDPRDIRSGAYPVTATVPSNADALRAFHGDPCRKAFYRARVEEHRAQDEITQGIGYEIGHGDQVRGCAVGCTLNNYDHWAYPVELGLREDLARVQDALFEALPHEAAMAFPSLFLDAIPVGADLSGVLPALTTWLVTTYGGTEPGDYGGWMGPVQYYRWTSAWDWVRGTPPLGVRAFPWRDEVAVATAVHLIGLLAAAPVPTPTHPGVSVL